MAYKLMHGVEHEADRDDPRSVSAIDFLPTVDYGPTLGDAIDALVRYTVAIGHALKKIDGGLFKHIPGTEGVFLEEWDDGNKQQHSRVWLIRMLT